MLDRMFFLNYLVRQNNIDLTLWLSSKKKTLNNNNLSFLNEKYSDVDISISEKDKGITLSELVVPEGKRNQGIGTQVMQDIINYADNNNKTIALTPDTTFGASKTRLKEFYKNLKRHKSGK